MESRGRRRFRGAARAVAGFLLGGLTTMEIIAASIGYLAVSGLLWATGTVQPERLITGPGFRAAWILMVLLLVRPITWVPYLLLFLAFRKLFDALMLRRRRILRNGLAQIAAITVLSGLVWLVVATVEGAGRALLSALAFATGSGSFDTLGSFRGDWTAARVALVVGLVVLGRLALPPLRLDLDLSDEPVLGFPEGARGTFDRALLLLALVGGGGIAVAAFVIGRS